VLAADPLYARAWLALAQVAYARLDFAGAAEAATRALEGHKGLAAAYRVRSQALFYRAEGSKGVREAGSWVAQSLADAEEAIRLGDAAYAARGTHCAAAAHLRCSPEWGNALTLVSASATRLLHDRPRVTHRPAPHRRRAGS